MNDPKSAPFATITPAPKDVWASLKRPTPAWHPRAKLGIFVHWGPYSVPAWAEPSGELGAVPEDEWFKHSAYAEWYGNSMRIEDSPAAERHRRIFGDAPYDSFLDQWTAEKFDPAAWAELFAAAGADIVIPTTKHHDGVALWDAPGTGDRNTVHRGPRRDLINDIAAAARAAGMRFGVYYSGGLDWSVTSFPPHQSHQDVQDFQPNDYAYNMYALAHLRDLIARFNPDVIWNDIDWPNAGKRTGPHSLHELITDFYAGNPDGVINDRWGDTHWDYRTSEYEMTPGNENTENWEMCRGIGLSFGFNQVEGPEQYLDATGLSCLLGDVVSRGGRLLINVGPTADGEIPAIQQQSLRGLGRWMQIAKPLLTDSHQVPQDTARASDDPWIRWLETPDALVALVDHLGETQLDVTTDGFDLSRANDLAPVCGSAANLSHDEPVLTLTMTEHGDGPAIVVIPRV